MNVSSLDWNTALCSTCAASLPPPKSPHTPNRIPDIHITPCCQKPICQACIHSNPRLARYNPCLACLGGVDVLSPTRPGGQSNIDGGVQDHELYIVGDDDDEDIDAGEEKEPQVQGDHSANSYSGNTKGTQDASSTSQDPIKFEPDGKIKYFLQKGDTLQAIVLRFGLNGRELCVMNKLPISTLSTTPHLLHSRSFILLPPSTRAKVSATTPGSEMDEQIAAAEAKRVRERAQKRLQLLTKEVDWRVAKAYVDLAEGSHPSDIDMLNLKRKEGGQGALPKGGLGIEALAIEQYLDDEEWEAEQRKEGRKTSVRTVPFAVLANKSA